MTRLIFVMLISLASFQARAGWISDWCARNLVAADPYQFESSSQLWIEREIQRLQIKKEWKKITREDAEMLGILVAEIRRRRAIQEILDAPPGN